MSNFEVRTIDKWLRKGSQKWQSAPRPHVVPLTSEAIAFMESRHTEDQFPTEALYGFTDSISDAVIDGSIRLCFRFTALLPEEEALALRLAENALSQFMGHHLGKA